jgi:DNA-binding CsgD family transcriptional regulator
MASTLVLRCLHSPLFRLCIERTVAILGRSSQCDLVVDDPSISRKHAEIRIREDRLLLKDLQSRNGTFVDGQPIQAIEVSEGQVVRFGKVSFTVQTDDEAEPCSGEETDAPATGTGVKGVQMLAAEESLTDAQRRVFELLLTGDPEKCIARKLNLSQHTVHNHVRAILHTFGVHSRLELLADIFHVNGNGH